MTLSGHTLRGTVAALAVLAVPLALSACGGGDGASTTTAAGGVEGCEEVPEAQPKQVSLKRPRQQVEPGEEITATVETNCGSFEIELDTQGSPKTTSSFVYMVDQGVYDGTPFHRVVDGFVIQGGDPKGDGTGNAGYTEVEKPAKDTVYEQGIVAMVKGQLEPPGISGSQFFVVTQGVAALEPDYAVLGVLTGGFDTVERIEALADPDLGEAGGEPSIPVVIDTITLSS